jgi:transcriptional antiterminator RfaH
MGKSMNEKPIDVGNGFETGWIAVNAQANREPIATENLTPQSFEVYCPKINKQIRHARTVRSVQRPLFPGYLFVRAPRNRALWRPILSTFGVRSIVRCGEELSFIDEGFIGALKAREVAGVVLRPEQPYRVGDNVVIAGGAFDGLVAEIIDLSEKQRLTVLVGLLGGKVRASIGLREVRPVGLVADNR